MGTLDYKQFTKRHRPHVHTPGARVFVTYRLAGSVAQATVREHKAQRERLESEVERVRALARIDDTDELKNWLKHIEEFNREWFVIFEEVMHRASAGPVWMREERVAENVAENLHKLDGSAYRLDAYCVMSNHVHAVFEPYLSEENLRETRDQNNHPIFISEHPSLSKIMRMLKGRSARECNLLLSRSGQFSEHESFDHVVRPGKFGKTLRYVLNNPVKAGLVKDWRNWRWNYCRAELLQTLMSDKLKFVRQKTRPAIISRASHV